MGSQCCCDANDCRIGNYMTNAEQQEERVVKLLLLGPGSTGKSTLFRSLQIVHSGTLPERELILEARLVRLNLLECIKVLINYANILYDRDNEYYGECHLIMTDDLKGKVQLITIKYDSLMSQDQDLEVKQLEEIGACMKTIWNLHCIQATYRHRNGNFAISDNLEHFFHKIDEIMHEDYVATEEDCLKNKTKTSGMCQYKYTQTYNAALKTFAILDVGGQRNERKKWMHYMDNVNGLLYVASLVDYNCVLYEDARTNAMLESVNLFFEIIQLEYFRHCPIILMLNKDDLLRELLHEEDNGLAKCFSPEGAWPAWPREEEYWDPSMDQKFWPAISSPDNSDDFEEYRAHVVDFLKRLFLNCRDRSNHTWVQSKQIYSHTTAATDPDIVDKVFKDVQVIVVAQNLRAVGLTGNLDDEDEVDAPVVVATGPPAAASSGAAAGAPMTAEELEHQKNRSRQMSVPSATPSVVTSAEHVAGAGAEEMSVTSLTNPGQQEPPGHKAEDAKDDVNNEEVEG